MIACALSLLMHSHFNAQLSVHARARAHTHTICGCETFLFFFLVSKTSSERHSYVGSFHEPTIFFPLNQSNKHIKFELIKAEIKQI